MAGPSKSLVESIFLEAIDAPHDRRILILDERCAGDAALRTRVEQLLAADSENAADGSVGERVVEFPSDPVPRQIGAYVINGVAGEGGMGAVYEAVHGPTGRRAAIKLVRAGISSTRGRERMRIEAETLGRLNSPNVAQVYDAGIADVSYPDGAKALRPFIAMEFVDGVAITEFVAAHAPSLPRLLELCEHVARAVHHAHQRGVIHRDLKPSNILVTADGVPKVVDFGIARFIDLATAGITVEGQVLGTVRYMSPEQASGDAGRVDTRSDVYALGAIFYELLAGRPVIEVGPSSSLGTLLRVIGTPPPRLRTLNGEIPRNLDAVIHKAIEHDPDVRYGSAQMLADDLERVRLGREVTARAPSAVERIAGIVKRNRAISAAAAMAVLAIIGGAAVSLWQAHVAMQQARATERALGEAQASLSYLSDILASCTPERDGRNTLVLDVAMKAADEIEGRFSDRPLVLSEMELALGRTFLSLGKGPEALKELSGAHAQRLRLLGPDDARTVEAELALDDAMLSFGKADPGGDFERPRDWFASHFGPNDRRTLRANLVAAKARLVSRKGDDPYQLVEMTAQSLERLYGPADDDTLEAKSLLAAWLLDRRDQPELVIPLVEPMIDLETRRFGTANAHTLNCIRLLAGAFNLTGQSERSITLLEPVMPAFDQVYGADHPEAVMAQRSLAIAYLAAGRLDLAEPALRRAVNGSMVAFGANEGRTESVRMRLAQAWIAQGRLDEAQRLVDDVLIVELGEAMNPLHYGLAMETQGRLFLAQGRPADAALRFEGAIAVSSASDRWDRTRVDATEGLGRCMVQLGRPGDASLCFADALEALARRFGDTHPETLRLRSELESARHSPRTATADGSLVRPIGSASPDPTAAWQLRLAVIAADLGRRDLADAWLKRVVDGGARLSEAGQVIFSELQARLSQPAAASKAP